MKKMYVTPQMQAVKINQSMNLLTASNPTASTASGNAFGGDILGGSGSGRSRECDWDDEW
jgi:hypothetical protein